VKVGILTGGGDVPGLNPCIKAATLRALEEGHEVVGIRRGWAGLLETDLDDPDSITRNITPLDAGSVRTIDRSGGTVLHTSRTNPAKVRPTDEPAFLRLGRESDDPRDHTPHVLDVIGKLGINALIPIGGDDTLSFARILVDEGVPLVAIPKTMDNDVPGTDYCIGFQTAIHRAAESVDRIRSTAGSHRETILFRLFGRDAGFTALEAAIAAWVDRVLIPEVPADISRLAELIEHDRHNPAGYSLVVLSEGANLGVPVPEEGPPDAYGHRKKTNVAEFLAAELHNLLPNVRFLPVDLTYILRSGEPDVYDKRMAIFYANVVMGLVEKGVHGVMAGHHDGEFVYTDIPGKEYPPRRVDPADYNGMRYRPSFERITGVYKPQTSR
jgi:ATP-dependent phosphofructokinase / diphosphate-dependent phosphofructokinase